MLGLFGARRPLGRDEFEWQMAAWQWLAEQFGGMEALAASPLVLPTTDWFPHSELRGFDRALELFDQVRRPVGMADWPCTLEAGHSDRPTALGGTLHLDHGRRHAPAGTFQLHRARASAIITYDPKLLKDPPALIATYAHELAHYRLASARTPPPGGEDLHEPATDLAAVAMGFGVFLANGAKNFRQFQNFDTQGWEARTQGYLSERALVTALAFFLTLTGNDPAVARQWLKPHLAGDLDKALKYLARVHPNLADDIAGFDSSLFTTEA